MNPGAQLGEKGEAFPALFEYRQKCPNFGKKRPLLYAYFGLIFHSKYRFKNI